MDTVRDTYRSGLFNKRMRRLAAWFISSPASIGSVRRSRSGVAVLIFTYELFALLYFLRLLRRTICWEWFRRSVKCVSTLLQCWWIILHPVPFMWYRSVFVCSQSACLCFVVYVCISGILQMCPLCYKALGSWVCCVYSTLMRIAVWGIYRSCHESIPSAE